MSEHITERIFAILLWYIDLVFCLSNVFTTSSQTSRILRIVAAGVAVIIGLRFVRKRYYSSMEWKSLILPMSIFVLFLPTFMLYEENSLAISSLQCFICYAIPLTLLAILYYKEDTVLDCYKYGDILLVLFDIYLIYILRHGLQAGIYVRTLQSQSSIGYQSTSYYGAYAFGISLFMLLFHNKQINKSKKFLCTAFRVATLLLSILVAIYGSGKGAIVLIAVFATVVICIYLKDSRKVGRLFIVIIFAAFIFLIISRFVKENDALSHGFDRIYALLGTREINYYTTSGRTLIYSRCWEAFLDSPIIGHGIGSAGGIGIGQPHQMFLEIMVEGGIIYLLIWIYIISSTIKRFIFLVREDSNKTAGYVFILLPFLAQFIGTQFSGFYLQSYTFWFFIAYIRLRYYFITSENSKVE